MTRERAQQEYEKLLREWNEEEDKIIEQAKKEGRLKPGLDSNRELFVETGKKYRERITKLKESIDD